VIATIVSTRPKGDARPVHAEPAIGGNLAALHWRGEGGGSRAFSGKMRVQESSVHREDRHAE
jgi:hypothetical protein